MTKKESMQSSANISWHQEKSQNSTIIIIGILFFVFGFVTWLNGILIPFLKLACQLKSDIQAFFVTFAFYIAYFFLAIPSSKILKSTGFKNGMALGLLIMAIGTLIFIPAANSRNFKLFLIGLFIQGAGLALLQTASNPYISILGPMESAAKRISIMGICNKVAGIISPLILGAIVLKDASSIETTIINTNDPTMQTLLLEKLSGRIIVPYTIITVVLILLAAMIKKSGLPDINMHKADSVNSAKASVFSYPHLMLGVLCIFLYVGVEVMAGDAIGMYGKALGMSLDQTKYFTVFTLLMMLVGYSIGIITIPKFITQESVLKLSAISGIFFTSLAFVTQGYISITFIALLGLSNALMWPSIFPLAISGIGPYIELGAALLVMGIAGGAILPIIYGYLKDKVGLTNSTSFFFVMLPCYLYILYYSIEGHKIGRNSHKL